jgi:hypothetical protein
VSRHIADWDGPGTEFTIADAVAFVDSLTLYGRRPLPKGWLRALRKRYGPRMIYDRHEVPGRPQACSWSLTIHQPERATLERLAEIPSGWFVVHAVDVAVDFLCADRRQAHLATEFLTRGVVQKWRRHNHSSHLEANTRYWKRDRRAPRNIALYGDRLSKTGLGACCHFELRFVGAAACNRAGLCELRDLMRGINVMALLNRQARITFIDQKRLDRVVENIALNNQRLTQRRRSSHRAQRGIARKRPDTVAAFKERMQRLLVRCLQDEAFPLEIDAMAKARSQSLWDCRWKLRTCLGRPMEWAEFTPTPRWHWWW